MGTVSARFLLPERRKIEDWRLAKAPVVEMARMLKRHDSPIFRELMRNFRTDDVFPKKYAGCFVIAAHQRTQQRCFTKRTLIGRPEL